MALIKIPKEMGSTPGIVDNSNATAITIDSSENVAFSGSVAISHGSGDTLTLTKSTTEPSLRIEGDSNKDFVITVSGELLTFTQNDGATDILTLDHDTKAAVFAGNVTINTDANSSLSIADGGTNAIMIKAAAGDELYMGANNTYAIRILNNGTNNVVLDNGSNLGIGIAAPDTMLTINTGAAADGIKYEVAYSPVNNLPRGVMTWDDGNSSGNVTGQIDTRYDGTTVDLHIGSLYSSGYNSLSRLVVKGNGNVSITDGNLAFASGHGIDFSASTNYGSSSSELLDDYEEGTWTPYLGTETQLGSPASTNYNNKYVKVGRLVKCTGWFNTFNYANVTSGTYMMIRNLPFPPEMHDTGMRFSYASNIGNSTYGYGHTALSAYYMLIGGTNGSPSHYNRSAAPTSGTAYSMITVTYYTAS